MFNARGEFIAAVEVTDRVRPGVVASTKGRWLKHVGGANANATVDERDADMGGGAVFHDNRVEVETVPPRWTMWPRRRPPARRRHPRADGDVRGRRGPG